MEIARTSFPEAVKLVMDTLKKERKLSVSQISQKTGLNRRTVEKSVKLLLEMQADFQEVSLDSEATNSKKIVEVKDRAGLLGLPENVQKLIIRTAYYPTPSQEEIVLIHLLINDAISPEKALSIDKSRVTQKLVKQGQLSENNGKLYLSDEGKIVAEGALEVYPELAEVNNRPIC
jgi:transposase-like protein